MPDIQVLLFEPMGAPSVDQMPVRTKRPNMTPGRPLLIRLLDLYGRQGYRHSLPEVQKLAKPQHIQKAYSRLEQQGWVSAR